MAAEMHAGVSTGLDLTQTQGTLKARREGYRHQIPPHKPVVGEAAFAIPETEEIQQVYYELHREQKFAAGFMYPPELVGATSHMSIGRKCHVYTVLYNLEVLGYAIDFAKAEKIAALVRSHLRNRKGYVLMTQDEFLSFVKKNGFKLEREGASIRAKS